MFVRKKRMILIAVFVGVIVLSNIAFPIIKNVSSPAKKYVVVIDAGHGARDGGCVGESGSIEKDLNLSYAKTLKTLLEQKDIKVVMTRENDNALYNSTDKNKKLAEMRARESTIKKAKPNLVVSIHMNSFGIRSAKGTKTYYAKDCDDSKTLATYIQKSLHYYVGTKTSDVGVGDYYILNCSQYTTVLVECGYLSNPEEEQLLLSNDYREQLMHSVYCGILIYLGFNYY